MPERCRKLLATTKLEGLPSPTVVLKWDGRMG